MRNSFLLIWLTRYYKYLIIKPRGNSKFLKDEQSIKQELIKLRCTKGYRHKDVALSIGISRRMYGLIETGRHNPSWAVAQRLEKFFGIPASELLANSTDESTGS
jgi:putative transcriptional regulator